MRSTLVLRFIVCLRNTNICLDFSGSCGSCLMGIQPQTPNGRKCHVERAASEAAPTRSSLSLPAYSGPAVRVRPVTRAVKGFTAKRRDVDGRCLLPSRKGKALHC